jgi:hypothetical protein
LEAKVCVWASGEDAHILPMGYQVCSAFPKRRDFAKIDNAGVETPHE